MLTGMTDAKPKLGWYRLTPAWLIYGLLVVQGLLWLSEWFQWPSWHKGYAVLSAVAVVGVVVMAMLLWLIVALLFRFRFQFGIRSLLIMTVAVAIPCSWLAVEMKAAKEQREAAAALEELGATVTWDKSAPGPAWLRGVLGEYFFARGIRVGLQGVEATDSTLEPLRALDQLQDLVIWSNNVTDAGLEYLKGLRDLKKLTLPCLNVTDAGVEHLAGLNQVEDLCLGWTQVTDAGLEKLVGLKRLQSLWLNDTKVTDIGVEHLQRMKQLRRVSLYNTHVTIAGVKKLQQALPNCEIIMTP